MDELNALIKNAKQSIFRFEGLQDYSAEDGDEMVKVFSKTGTLLHHPKDSSWWKKMKLKNDAGIKTCRVRSVAKPLTPYTKMELAYLREASRFSGDEVRIIHENACRKIIGNCPDFWMFDDRIVFQIWYGPQGKFIGAETISDHRIADFVIIKRKLIENSGLLEGFG